MVTGSAPLSPEVLEFCRVALGCMLVEAYGQTETTSLVCVSWPKDATGGHVGGPTPCANVKLGDVPELNYFAKDMKGEVGRMIHNHVSYNYFRFSLKDRE